jgi:hypothetical protein
MRRRPGGLGLPDDRGDVDRDLVVGGHGLVGVPGVVRRFG